MSSSTVQDALKAWKSFVFSIIKPYDILSLFLKAGLVISSFALVSLFFYLSLSYPPHYHQKPLSYNFLQHHSVAGAGGDEGPTNISHVLFGIGGSAMTWHTRRRYTELWWQPNVTRGYVWLDREPLANETWTEPEKSPPYRVSEDTTSFEYTCWYGSRSAIRIARIVKESFELGLSNVRWFVMGDDDTVFFTENLMTVLSKYDHNQMYYIGGNSESVEQDVIHSYSMAFGGGGFAVSYPLAAELVKILDGCINRYSRFYGSDQKIQACISEIGVQVSKEQGFHQVDIRGNPYGLLAAHPVAPLVSLHHLDHLEPMFPNMTQVDAAEKLVGAYKTDPGRVLQKSFCYDLRRNWTVSVAWGYSVELYPWLPTAKELETAFRTFLTWRSGSEEPFLLNTRPVRNHPCARPLVFFLDRVENMGGGHTRSTYTRHVEDSGKRCDRVDYLQALGVELVNVSASQFTPDLWKKAPRRQCCEIINGDDGEGGVQVKVRGCNQFESVNPPEDVRH